MATIMTCDRLPEENLMRVSFRSRALAGFVLAALAAAGPASAYTYLESAWGTPVSAQSARGLAMGGATVAVPDGSYSLLSNPAMNSTG